MAEAGAESWISITIEGTKKTRTCIRCLSGACLGDVITELLTDNERLKSIKGSKEDPASHSRLPVPVRPVPMDLSPDTPNAVVRSFGIRYIILTTENTDAYPKRSADSTTMSALDVLMRAQKQYAWFPDQRDPKTAKDTLFNELLKVAKSAGVGFLPSQKSMAIEMFTSLTEVMWYLDPFYDRLTARSIKIPSEFSELAGLRDYNKQHKKKPTITATELATHVNAVGEILMKPWLMNSKFSKFRSMIVALHDGLDKYHTYLSDHVERSQKKHHSTEPIRSLQDKWALEVVEGKAPGPDFKETYGALEEKLMNISSYEPVNLEEYEPLDQSKRRKWLLSLIMPFPISKFTWSHGNNLGNLTTVWKIPPNLEDRKHDKDLKIMNEIREKMPVYATRQMRKDFIEKYANCIRARPAILRNMFQFVSHTVLTPENEAERKVDERVCEFLLKSNDPDLIYDLRALNGRIKDPKFDPFWDELTKYLEEKSTVDDRRKPAYYMPFAISVEDLRTQILSRLPEGTPAPSTSWIRLNFQPTNPTTKAAMHYTGRFPVKYAVQQRLLRAQHVDDLYALKLFDYMKCMASRYKTYSSFICLDDKAIVPVGEPGVVVSTGVRAHHRGLTVIGQNGLLCLDHDYHVAGIVPSVCFLVDLPENPRDSWYHGEVHVSVKDKVFEPSSPTRHAAETVKILRSSLSEDGITLPTPLLFIYTDGGPDHRTTYKSVQTSLLTMFVALDLDMLIAVRTAPSQSYNNPAERQMSLLNLALQNVALSRGAMPDSWETQMKSLKSLKLLRNAAQKKPLLKEHFSTSMKVPIDILKERFGHLKKQEQNVQVHDAASDEALADQEKILGAIDNLAEFTAGHVRIRHYSYQVKKCTEPTCGYCRRECPPRLPDDVFESLSYVPDPMLADGSYKPFDEVYGTETTDKDRPSLTSSPESNELDKKRKSVLVGAKVRGFILCTECGKRRVVYSSSKLTSDHQLALVRVQEELLYCCGDPLFPAGPYADVMVVRESINCQSPMESAYYAGVTMQFGAVCWYCSDPVLHEDDSIEELKRTHGTVRPICRTCYTGGLKVVTRNPFKIPRQ